MNIINIEHISKVFGEKQVFDDISCGIHQGDKIGIIGINGTGKTTLLKIIAGLEEPDAGAAADARTAQTIQFSRRFIMTRCRCMMKKMRPTVRFRFCQTR